MRFGYWMPIFGGWLRNVADEDMTIAWPYIRDLAVASEQHGFWWQDEALQYGAPFDVHDARYARTEEWLSVLGRLLREEVVTHDGPLYHLSRTVLEPKPSRLPPVYMGGESPRAKDVIGGLADAYVMHGDDVDVIAAKIADMSARRAAFVPGRVPLTIGVAGYVICRPTRAEAQAELERILDVKASAEAYTSYQDFLRGSQLESQVSIEEYSVSNRGLRAGLIGTPSDIIARLRAYEQAGVDLMLLQFSPQHSEMARFGRDVIGSFS
jgi:dimethylsulfone monooxygenase